jgi:hypothetical protein
VTASRWAAFAVATIAVAGCFCVADIYNRPGAACAGVAAVFTVAEWAELAEATEPDRRAHIVASSALVLVTWALV